MWPWSVLFCDVQCHAVWYHVMWNLKLWTWKWELPQKVMHHGNSSYFVYWNIYILNDVSVNIQLLFKQWCQGYQALSLFLLVSHNSTLSRVATPLPSLTFLTQGYSRLYCTYMNNIVIHDSHMHIGMSLFYCFYVCRYYNKTTWVGVLCGNITEFVVVEVHLNLHGNGYPSPPQTKWYCHTACHTKVVLFLYSII